MGKNTSSKHLFRRNIPVKRSSDAEALDTIRKHGYEGFQDALTLAHQIHDPWIRSLAFATLAEWAEDKETCLTLVNEAIDCAVSYSNLDRRIPASAKALVTLVTRSFDDELAERMTTLLDVIAKEPSPVLRARVLRPLMEVTKNGPTRFFQLVSDELVKASFTPLLNGKRNRKGESALAAFIGDIWRHDPGRAELLAQRIQSDTLRSRAWKNIETERLLSRGQGTDSPAKQ